MYNLYNKSHKISNQFETVDTRFQEYKLKTDLALHLDLCRIRARPNDVTIQLR